MMSGAAIHRVRDMTYSFGCTVKYLKSRTRVTWRESEYTALV
jgi:hypothetical protein